MIMAAPLAYIQAQMSRVAQDQTHAFSPCLFSTRSGLRRMSQSQPAIEERTGALHFASGNQQHSRSPRALQPSEGGNVVAVGVVVATMVEYLLCREDLVNMARSHA